HIKQTGSLLLQPDRGTYRTIGECQTAACLVGDLYAFAIGHKHNRVIAYNVAATYGCETYGVFWAWTNLTFTAVNGDLLQVPPQCICQDFAHAHCGARG